MKVSVIKVNYFESISNLNNQPQVQHAQMGGSIVAVKQLLLGVEIPLSTSLQLARLRLKLFITYGCTLYAFLTPSTTNGYKYNHPFIFIILQRVAIVINNNGCMETLRLMGVAQLFKFNCRYRIRGTCTTVLGIYDIYGFLLLLISSTRVTLFARFCIQDGVILLWFLLVNYRMVLGRIKHYPVSLKARRFVKLHSLLQAVNTKKQTNNCNNVNSNKTKLHQQMKYLYQQNYHLSNRVKIKPQLYTTRTLNNMIKIYKKSNVSCDESKCRQTKTRG